TLPRICAELFAATRMPPVFDSAIALRADKIEIPDMLIVPALLMVALPEPKLFEPLVFQVPLLVKLLFTANVTLPVIVPLLVTEPLPALKEIAKLLVVRPNRLDAME